MTTNEFMRTTMTKVIKRHCIRAELDEAEFFELIRKIMDICHENDMKEMKIDYMNDNDWKDK